MAKLIEDNLDMDFLSEALLNQIRNELKRRIKQKVSEDIEPLVEEIVQQVSKVNLTHYLDDRDLMKKLNVDFTVNRKPIV